MAWVPTGIKTGVGTLPRGSDKHPARGPDGGNPGVSEQKTDLKSSVIEGDIMWK